jgi:hypothetical protein
MFLLSFWIMLMTMGSSMAFVAHLPPAGTDEVIPPPAGVESRHGW